MIRSRRSSSRRSPGSRKHKLSNASSAGHASKLTQSLLWNQYSLIAKDYKVKRHRRDHCCADDVARPWILRLTFVLVVAFGLVNSALELRYSVYASQTMTINGGDQMVLPTSTYFNQFVNFTTENPDDAQYLQLHLLKDIPRISENTSSYQNAGVFYMPSWTYQYWGLRLLKGSSIKISICCDLHLQFYILRGDKNLQKWSQEILFTDYDFHTSIHPQPSCKKSAMFKSFLFTIRDSDTYYISFSTSVGWRFLTRVNIVLDFNRTYYDLSNTKYSCYLTEPSCNAKLKYASKDLSLIQALSNGSSNGLNAFREIKVTFTPIPRWLFYLKLLGGICITVVLATVMYTIWRFCASICSSEKKEKQPILYGERTTPYLFSMRNAVADDKWVVVTPLRQRDSSTSRYYEIEERDTGSLTYLTDSVPNEGEPYRKDSAVSIESYLMKSCNESVRDRVLYRNRVLEYDQQLLDSCMTSAGVSAI